MNCNIDLKDFWLPYHVSRDGEYLGDLQSKFDKYIEHIEGIGGLPNEVKKNVKDNADHICKSIQCYYNADLKNAHKEIENVVKKYFDSKYIVSDINNSYAFRGAAPRDIRPNQYNKDKYLTEYDKMMDAELFFFRARVGDKKLELKDMRHIPYDERGKISTQRFSIAGVPCWYFAVTTYCAWLEMGMPDERLFYASAYKLPSNLKVFNLCQHQLLIDGMSSWDNDNEKDGFYNYVEIFPLTIATSYTIDEMNRHFKSEYIVSQLIMDILSANKIDGIAYLSKKLRDVDAYPQAVNLALITLAKEEKKYWSRIDEVWASDPVCFDKYINSKKCNYKEDYITLCNRIYSNDENNGKINLVGNDICYCDTRFSDFDEFLARQKFIKFDKNK